MNWIAYGLLVGILIELWSIAIGISLMIEILKDIRGNTR